MGAAKYDFALRVFHWNGSLAGKVEVLAMGLKSD
jgi:hypothetical protein